MRLTNLIFELLSVLKSGKDFRRPGKKKGRLPKAYHVSDILIIIQQILKNKDFPILNANIG